MITVLTLNLWGYTDWENRLNNITDFISRIDADVVALQEVQKDESFSGKSQSEVIAECSDYKFHVYASISKKPSLSKNGEFIDHGMAFLSKFELRNFHTQLLNRQQPEHEQCAALHTEIRVAGRNISFCNVHFHNTDTTSLLHLSETVQFCRKQKIMPIILGDFNNYELSRHKNLLTGYKLSTEYKKYASFIKDGGTLDYIAAPANQFIINTVGTSKSYLSDHKAVWAKLQPQDN